MHARQCGRIRISLITSDPVHLWFAFSHFSHGELPGSHFCWGTWPFPFAASFFWSSRKILCFPVCVDHKLGPLEKLVWVLIFPGLQFQFCHEQERSTKVAWPWADSRKFQLQNPARLLKSPVKCMKHWKYDSQKNKHKAFGGEVTSLRHVTPTSHLYKYSHFWLKIAALVWIWLLFQDCRVNEWVARGTSLNIFVLLWMLCWQIAPFSLFRDSLGLFRLMGVYCFSRPSSTLAHVEVLKLQRGGWQKPRFCCN